MSGGSTMAVDVGLEELQAGAAAALGVAPGEAGIEAVPIDYEWSSPSTAGLWRVEARAGERHERCFVKLLRHPRLWPGLEWIPDAWRDEFVEYFPWRFELDMHEAGVPALLPAGMRVPQLHHVAVLDDDHVLLTWEYVDEAHRAWRDADFERAAELLGRFAARRRAGAPVNGTLPPACHERSALRYIVERRLLIGTAPTIEDPATWDHPALAAAIERTGEASLPTRMVALSERVLDVLAMTEALPQTFAHGDASPQNLLLDAGEDGGFVVIDWGFGTLLPVGFDLGQLVVGLLHTGARDADELGRWAELVVAPYLDGLRAEGLAATEDEVWSGFVGGLACRTALLSIPFERLGEPPTSELTDHLAERVLLTARMLDLIDRRLPAPAG